MNTKSTYTYRRKYRLASLAVLLRNALVCEKICKVDRSEGKYIDSPYGSQPTTVVQDIVGTYATAAWTTTADTLEVTDEFVVAEHVYDFEEVLTAFDVMASRLDEQNYSVAAAIDSFVLNELCETGTGTYTTPVGGFNTAANINIIMSNLLSKVAGYESAYKGTYLVIENVDMPGFLQAQATSGFNFADKALNNGFFTNYMGVDIYVVRDGLFITDTVGTKTWTNDEHRVFGVKGTSTYAAPRTVRYDEKSVPAKTGKEIVTWGYIGFKNWAPKITLTVDITLA